MIKVVDGTLYVEKAQGVGMLPVDKVVYHGIFEDDLDLIAGLTILERPVLSKRLRNVGMPIENSLPC